MAISGFFFKAATMEVASSGNEVPPATSVRPMMDSLTPQSAGYAAGTVYKEITSDDEAGKSAENV